MTPLKPISGARKAVYGVAFFVLFVAAWGVATFGGFASPIFLADPLTMLREGYALFAKYGFAKDVALTIWRVVGGFVLAASVAVPLGIAMGAYKPIEAFFEPFVSFARYLPASAFIPLLILWAGIGELQKLLVIFIGSFFQIVLMVAVTVGGTRRDLVRARDRRDAAAGARMGMDVRDRRRADRRVEWHRTHDHGQPGAAQYRPDHFRHHRNRHDRARVRFRFQVGEPAAVSLEPGLR
jgi:ABC-type proline/glycine betaine transport system permease subunit